MTIEVRAIQETDIEGFAAALSSVVSERKYLLTLEPPSIDNVASFIRASIDNNYAQYIAQIDGEIIGWADIIPRELEALRHVGLLGIGVVREHRAKGIGKQLLKRVIAHSWRIGLTRLELEVFASNVSAVALYEKFGFELEGTKRNARLVDGIYRDVHIMAQCRI